MPTQETNEWKQLSPAEEAQLNKQNIALGATLTAFCVGVYWYSTRQVHRSPEDGEIAAINTELLQEESSGRR